MSVLDRRVSLTLIVRAALVLYGILLVGLHSLVTTPYVDGRAVLAAVATAGVLIGGLSAASGAWRAIHVLLTQYATTAYLMFPIGVMWTSLDPTFPYLEAFAGLTPAAALRLQTFGLLGAVVTVGGFLLAERWPVRVPEAWTRAVAQRAARYAECRAGFFVTAVLFLVTSAYVLLKVGWGSLSGIPTESGDNLWNLASVDVPLYIGMALLVYGGAWSGLATRGLLIATVAVMVIAGLLAGSRSAFLVTAVNFGLVYIIMTKDRPVRISRILMGSAVYTVLFLVSFVVATSAKSFYLTNFVPGNPAGLASRVYGGWTDFLLGAAPSADEDAGELSTLTDVEGMSSDSAFAKFMAESGVGRVVKAFVFRLADSRAPYAIINERWAHPPGLYLGAGDSMTRLANALVPGTPFRENVSPTQLYEWIYEDRKPIYSGETWGLWTMLFIYFGEAGAVVAAFAVALTAGAVFGAMLPWTSSYAPVATMLTLASFNAAIYGGLVELWLPPLVRVGISAAVFVALWRLLGTAWARFRSPAPASAAAAH
jgi:hypothetical protein